jgi:hypothetical protein
MRIPLAVILPEPGRPVPSPADLAGAGFVISEAVAWPARPAARPAPARAAAPAPQAPPAASLRPAPQD